MRLGVMAGLWWLGCAGTAPAPEPEVSLDPPWAELALPVGAGQVEVMDRSKLHIVYVETDVTREQFADRYGKALVESGYEELSVRVLGPMIAVDYSKDAAGLRLVVASAGKRVDVEVSKD